MTRLELDIALRYLRSRRGSRLLSFITVIAMGGVVVGVSALIVIMGVMNGLQHDMRAKILIGSPDIRVTQLGAAMRMPRWRDVVDLTKEDEDVTAAAPFVMTPGLFRRDDAAAGGYGSPVRVVGFPTSESDTVTSMHAHVVEGSFDFRAVDVTRIPIVVGQSLAARLLVYVGDPVKLWAFGSIRESASVPSASDASEFLGEVTGIFYSGMYDYDDGFVYVPLEDAQRMANLGQAATGVELRVREQWDAPAVAQRLREKLDMTVYSIEDWQEQNATLFSALKLEKLAMAVIVFLIVLVAAFNIVAVLTMLVRDKTREIGILRAMGMKAVNIRRIFLAQGISIGAVGTALGLMIGLAISIAVGRYKLIRLPPETYFIDHLPVRTELLDVMVIAAGSMLIALLATLKPSSEAASLYPLEAIRRE